MNRAPYERIIMLISTHDAGDPITARQLTEQLGCDRITVWEAVRRARLSGIPIGSSKRSKKGYFLIRTEAEMERFLSHFLGSAYETLAIARAMVRTFPDLRERYPLLFSEGGGDE